MATDGVERVELDQPRGALHGAGAKTENGSLHSNTTNDLRPQSALWAATTASPALPAPSAAPR